MNTTKAIVAAGGGGDGVAPMIRAVNIMHGYCRRRVVSRDAGKPWHRSGRPDRLAGPDTNLTRREE
jgi:hypothetical protein